MINLLLAASLSPALAAAAPPPPAEASPAMFVVHDRDTTIYLFGTFHELDGRSDWLNGTLRSAFDSSQELVLETLIPERQPSPAQAAAPIRQPFANISITPSASFLATTRLAISAGKAHGMSVANGADMVLRHLAEGEGKRVEGLESLDSQLRMFDRLPSEPTAAPRPAEAARAAAPAPAPAGPAAMLSSTMSDMQSAWKRGDQTVFVRILDQLSRNAPDTYRMMFTERNARWADWIAARLNRPGTVFVAVGAGHLAGKDSVLVRLAQRGIASARLD